MIHDDDAVVFDEGAAGETLFFGVGVDAIGEVPPMDEIVADGVTPVLAGVFRRIGLVKEVPAALPETEAVGVVEHGLRVDVMVEGSVWVAGVGLT